MGEDNKWEEQKKIKNNPQQHTKEERGGGPFVGGQVWCLIRRRIDKDVLHEGYVRIPFLILQEHLQTG